MGNPVVLYSVQSFLAYYINTRYYQGVHYVWCSPYYNCATNAALVPTIPYTASPKKIYERLMDDISITDFHHNKYEIKRNTMGLLKGAKIMLGKGKINDEDYNSIEVTVKKCQEGNAIIEYFRPLIYVIPYELNEAHIKSVEINERALPLSNEFIIDELTAGMFDIIDSKGGIRF